MEVLDSNPGKGEDFSNPKQIAMYATGSTNNKNVSNPMKGYNSKRMWVLIRQLTIFKFKSQPHSSRFGVRVIVYNIITNGDY